jgi:hypothetical protein
MRKIFLFIIIATSLCGVSCKKYLDINNNPNSPTVVGVSPVLPLAIVNAASLTSNLNDYGGQTVGYAANAGGYGGFGSMWTYDYPPSQGESYWDNGYTTLENLQYILNNSQGIDSLAYFNAAAKIMKAYVFQMLVDQFNNVPYTNALQGASDFVPTYDDAATIYPKLTLLIDSAISLIEAAANYPAAQAATTLTGATDPLFQGNMLSWIQFANSLKLRMIIRAASVVTFSDMTFSSEGFLTTDAVVNPGYQMANTSSGTQVNPSWGTWGSTYAGARVGQAWIPATFVFGYYDGTKLADPGRGAAIFYQFPSNTPTNQLGITPPNNTLTSPSPAGAWYSGGGSGTTLGNAVGVLKGPNMGEPLMLLAESDFLQAEADLRGILSGTAATDFNNGILASFTYLYELPNLSVAPGLDPIGDEAAYLANNSTSYLVNFSLASTPAEQLEAIITQKYIALDFINGGEAWNEYRRTGYPVSSPSTLNDPYGSFASTQSQATRPDHLPTRLPYPASEAATNAANVPQGVNIYTSTIFWAH